jgi:plasmid stability protein
MPPHAVDAGIIINADKEGVAVAAITIRNVDPELKRQLRIRAAIAGHSMEAEARSILRAELATQDDEPADLYQRIRRHVDPLGGVDLPLPDREPMREPPALPG